MDDDPQMSFDALPDPQAGLEAEADPRTPDDADGDPQARFGGPQARLDAIARGGGDPQARLDAIARDLLGHLPCPSEPCATCTQLVPGEGSPVADVVVLGEAPGANEDQSGRPFVGPAGKQLDGLLEEAGLVRADIFITNIVKARPPGNRDPRADEVAHHWPWLEAQLEVLQPRLIVTLGRHALGRFAPKTDRIAEVHGTVLERDGRRLFPLYHPAAALHNPGLRDTLSADARALGQARDGA